MLVEGVGSGAIKRKRKKKGAKSIPQHPLSLSPLFASHSSPTPSSTSPI